MALTVPMLAFICMGDASSIRHPHRDARVRCQLDSAAIFVDEQAVPQVIVEIGRLTAIVAHLRMSLDQDLQEATCPWMHVSTVSRPIAALPSQRPRRNNITFSGCEFT